MIGQSAIKLVVTDMDGTLLNSKKELHPDFGKVLQLMRDRGVRFAVASGRQYDTLKREFYPDGDDIIFIAENGTYVKEGGQTLYLKPLDKAEVCHVLEAVRRLDNAFVLLCGKQSAWYESNDPRLVAELAKFYLRNQKVDNLMEVEDDILKIALCDFGGAEQNSFPALAHLRDRMQVSVSGEIWLDIMTMGANKGEAVRHVQQHLAIGYHETMVFGDYLNDLEMMETGFYSYAMQNAHPDLKKAARFEAPGNDQNGVIKIICEKISCPNQTLTGL